MIKQRVIRIGTRDSALALYQAKHVQLALQETHTKTEVIEITSDGDTDLITPLYEMGIQGIFTRSLDIALLENRIDIAVHSAKDVPTQQARGLSLCAMLKRATPFDCIVLPKGISHTDFSAPGTIATSSLRRKLQWINRYPDYRTENLRGNIQTRLNKLDASSWKGAIFAQAALVRLDITSHHYLTLDWMLPSPAQGAIGIVCREDDSYVLRACEAINNTKTEMCVSVERDFLAALQGGCAVPIAAYAFMKGDEIFFRGMVMSLNAQEKCEIEITFRKIEAPIAGQLAAQKILAHGADSIIKTFRPV